MIKGYEKMLRERMVDLLHTDLDSFVSSPSRKDKNCSVLLLQPQLSPNQSVWRNVSTATRIAPASAWITFDLELMSAKSFNSRGHELYDWMRRSPELHTAARLFFAGRCQAVFNRSQRNKVFRCHLMTPASEMPSIYSRFPQPAHPYFKYTISKQSKASSLAALHEPLRLEFAQCRPYETSQFANLEELRENLRASSWSRTAFKRSLNGVYLRPQLPDPEAIDSSMIQIDRHGQPRAYFFQFIISEKTTTASPGLIAAWEFLPPEVQRVPPALILVVPNDILAKIRVQKIVEMPDAV